MHRGMGSAGGSQGSGSRVLPGKRMAGNMGNESVTVKNLKVLQVDEANGIVVVNGASRYLVLQRQQLINFRLRARSQEPDHQGLGCNGQALACWAHEAGRRNTRVDCADCGRGGGHGCVEGVEM